MNEAQRKQPIGPAWQPGTPVAVRNRFTERWTEGFVIASSEDLPEAAYWLRRASDGTVLPVPFSPSDLRAL
jgi:hypothetical protein